MAMPSEPYVKPVVFFSHSSRDKAALVKLRDCFVGKTGSSIDVFLSSDGQSIRLGKNWVHAVEVALRNAKLMFVFLTPESVRSQWVLFEAGCAYGRNLQVIPVGMWGVDVGAVGAPLNLLQGFNVTSPESLSNIIAETNRTFGLTHKDFDATDYATVCAEGPHKSAISNFVSLIDDVQFFYKDIRCKEAMQRLADIAKAAGLDAVLVEDRVRHACRVPGLTVRCNDANAEIDASVDTFSLESMVPLVNAWLADTLPAGAKGIYFRFYLKDGVGRVQGGHSISGRLSSAGVRFGTPGEFVWEDMSFELDELIPFNHGSRKCALVIAPRACELSLKRVAALADLLLERGILFLKS